MGINPDRGVVAVHGGAGAVSRASLTAEKQREYEAGLADSLRKAEQVLAQGGSAIDAVTVAVQALEDHPLFNAGHGAVFTSAATHELDASIMDGLTLNAGAVACIEHARNPIAAARAVMEQSPFVLLVGPQADAFARSHGVGQVDASYYSTPERKHQLLRAQEQGRMALVLDHDGAADAHQGSVLLDPDRHMGTVGAVARDRHGNLAAATSTGGLTNKLPGRAGDTPVIGAGCYANNATCAVSCTGTGEAFMKAVAAHDVSALIAYRELGLEAACRQVLEEKVRKLGGVGGLIAIDRHGNVSMPFTTQGMYRGYMHVGAEPVTAIYH